MLMFLGIGNETVRYLNKAVVAFKRNGAVTNLSVNSSLMLSEVTSINGMTSSFIERSIVAGPYTIENDSSIYNSVMVGQEHEIDYGLEGSLLVGRGHKPTQISQNAIGRFSDLSDSQTSFAIGAGFDNSTRKNIWEVDVLVIS